MCLCVEGESFSMPRGSFSLSASLYWHRVSLRPSPLLLPQPGTLSAHQHLSRSVLHQVTVGHPWFSMIPKWIICDRIICDIYSQGLRFLCLMLMFFSFPVHVSILFFPGAPLVWKSLVKDSYIVHPLPAPPTDPQCWYGRRTDDMGGWPAANATYCYINYYYHYYYRS